MNFSISVVNKGSSLFLIFLLTIILAFTGCDSKVENAKKKYRVATDATLIPMSFVNEENKLDGFEVDLIKEIARVAGFDVELINVEWAGLFGGLITQKYDMAISSVTILEERKKRMAFSRPYLQSGLALVVRKDTNGVSSMEDIRKQNLTAGAQVGTTAYFFLESFPDIPKKGYQLHGHAVADLINGEIDVAVGESSATLYYKNQQKDYFQKIKMVGNILTEEYYGIVFRKDDPELLQQIDSTLNKLLGNGFVDKLHQKWELGRAAQVPSTKKAG